MQMLDLFEHVVVLAEPAQPADSLHQRLHRHGCRTWMVDLSRGWTWSDTLAEALAQARQSGSRGVLLLAAQQAGDTAFWRSQDALVEHLSAQPWDIVYLGHDSLCEEARHDERPRLLHCDMPPSQVSAVAVSCEVLDYLRQTMPEGAIDGTLHSCDWLSMACWLSLARASAGRGLVAWPALMHARQQPAHSTPLH